MVDEPSIIGWRSAIQIFGWVVPYVKDLLAFIISLPNNITKC